MSLEQELVDKYKDFGKLKSRMGELEFLRFYLAANKLGMSCQEMYVHLGYTRKPYESQESHYIVSRIKDLRYKLLRHEILVPKSIEEKKQYEHRWFSSDEINFVKDLFLTLKESGV